MEALVNNFVVLGSPSFTQTRGEISESQIFTEMYRLLEVNKTRTTPLHHQSDGMVERFNRTIEDQLSKFVDENRDWDTHIPLLLMAYSTAIHETTGCTPAQLMMGHDLRLSIDVLNGQPEDEISHHHSSYAEELQTCLERVHSFTRTHMQLRSNSVEHYDSASNWDRLEVGALCGYTAPSQKSCIGTGCGNTLEIILPLGLLEWHKRVAREPQQE